MNRALICLQGNAPDALRVIEPKVLRFWVSPRPVVSDMWTALGVICAFVACLWMSEHLPTIPVRDKPKHAALEAECRSLNNRCYQGTDWHRVEANMAAAVEQFLDSLQTMP